jgi:soluble lytic murein transglycosylase
MAQGHTEWKTLLALAFMVCLGVAVAFFSWRIGHKIWLVFARYSMWDRAIVEASSRNNVDPLLVKAVIWRESRFRTDASGLAGEVGLMQIRPEGAVADWSRMNNVDAPSRGVLFIPELNIEVGSWYLGKAVRKWSSFKECFELALCEYNAGARRAADWRPLGADESVRDKINISSTLAYVNSVMSKYNEYVRERDSGASSRSDERKKGK